MISMFYQLLFIHLFRPFLRYTPTNSPLPADVSPRKHCTHAAGMISKLFRFYKRTHGLLQISSIAVYIVHFACTIHILNLPDREARRDIIYGVRHLEEIAQSWLCARRTLTNLSTQIRKWQIELPEDAANVLACTDALYGSLKVDPKPSLGSDSPSPSRIVAQKLPAGAFLANQCSAHPLVTPQSNNMTLSQPHPLATIHTTISDSSEGFSFTAAGSNSTITAATATTNNIPPTSNPKSTKQNNASSDAQKRAYMHTRLARTVTHSSQTHPDMLFGCVDTPFEDCQACWLRDQSAIFDEWEKSIHEQSSGGPGMTSNSHTMHHNSAPDGSNGSDPNRMGNANPMGMGHGHGAIQGNGTGAVNGMNNCFGAMNEVLSRSVNNGQALFEGRSNAVASIGHESDFLDYFEGKGRFDYSRGGR
jgi:hypothetical protein